jgi:hypothetical protein
LRPLASDYGVVHTTLLDYFERPDVAREIKQAEKQLRAERRAAADRLAAERRIEREVRKKAKEQAAREHEHDRRVRAVVAERASRRRRPRDRYGAWLDERDARRPFTRADLYSRSDEIAAEVVAAGGGMQAVIDATNLRTLENVVRLIDPAILKQALDNDVLEQAHPPYVP